MRLKKSEKFPLILPSAVLLSLLFTYIGYGIFASFQQEENLEVSDDLLIDDTKLDWNDVSSVLEVHCTGACHSIAHLIPNEEAFLEGQGPELIKQDLMPPKDYESYNEWTKFDRDYVLDYLKDKS